jgi:hypothetical protein
VKASTPWKGLKSSRRLIPWFAFVLALLGLTYFAWSAPWVSGPGISGGSGSGIPVSDKCAANGVACLGVDGLHKPTETLPSAAHTKFSGAFTVASCTRDGEVGKSTTEGLGYCDGSGSNWVKQSLYGDAFNTLKIGGSTASALGSTTLELIAGTNITLTGLTSGNPTQVTINTTAGTQTASYPMQLMTQDVGNANAFWDTQDGTNFDFSGLRFIDAQTGCGYYKHKISPKLASTPAWNITVTSKAASGSGGNVVLTVSAKDFATNVALDAALTALETLATHAVNTSANTTIFDVSGTNLDSTEAIAANNFLVVSLCRIAGNASDTVNAIWDVLDVSVKYNENS